jgi:hypothetical protein
MPSAAPVTTATFPDRSIGDILAYHCGLNDSYANRK